MRLAAFAISIIGALGLVSCERDSARNTPPAREAGREAYQASKDVKRGARHAARTLEHAGKEFDKGWNEERNKTQAQHSDHPDH